MLICPSYFDGRLDGIGRVSGVFGQVLARRLGQTPFVVSANDPVGSPGSEPGRAFGRRYRSCLLWALVGRLPHPAPPAVVCTHLGLAPVARLVAARLRRPYGVFLHGVEVWRPLPARTHWGLARARRLASNSENTLREFRRWHPRHDALPGEAVPLGVSVPALVAGGGSSTTEPGRLLCVARMDWADRRDGEGGVRGLYKGFCELVEAVEKLRHEGVKVSLRLVGDGSARGDLESWVRTRREADAVTFLGRIPDEALAAEFAAADVFVLPSDGEGFGLVYVEAMAHGIPCVGVRAGATDEVIADGETGAVARPRDAADLARALSGIVGDRARRASLAQAARRRYEDHFTLAAFEARVGSYLDRLEAARG